MASLGRLANKVAIVSIVPVETTERQADNKRSLVLLQASEELQPLPMLRKAQTLSALTFARRPVSKAPLKKTARLWNGLET